MPTRSTLGLSAALLLSAGTAHAADDSATFSQCMDKASSTASMSSCIQSETQAQDLRLNKAYKQLMGKLNAQKKENLRSIQRSWVAYRDANCSFHASLDNGTLARVDAALCVKDLTRDRAAELERMANPEG